jgi:hypothetical protein
MPGFFHRGTRRQFFAGSGGIKKLQRAPARRSAEPEVPVITGRGNAGPCHDGAGLRITGELARPGSMISGPKCTACSSEVVFVEAHSRRDDSESS